MAEFTVHFPVKLNPRQAQFVRQEAKRRGLPPCALIREAAVAYLEGDCLWTPDRVRIAITDAHIRAEAEVGPKFDIDGKQLEEVLEELEASEVKLRAQLAQLKSEELELSESRLKALEQGDVDRASRLAEELESLKFKRQTIEDTLRVRGERREEIKRHIQGRDELIEKRAAEILLEEAFPGVCATFDEAAAAVGRATDCLVLLAGEGAWPSRESLEQWRDRLLCALLLLAAQAAQTELSKWLLESKAPSLLDFRLKVARAKGLAELIK